MHIHSHPFEGGLTLLDKGVTGQQLCVEFGLA
jgi:hypothetical protein